MTDFLTTIKHRKLLTIIICVVALLIVILGAWIIIDAAENRRLDAESVVLADDLKIVFGDEAKVSDFLAELKGSMVDDHAVATDALGAQEVTFEYINARNRKRQAKFTIEVVDITPPEVYGGTYYAVPQGYDGDLTALMISGDDLDDHPRREVLGDYDLSQPGVYELEYTVTDASGNQMVHPFTLEVVAPSDDEDEPESTPASEKLAFRDVIKNYKTASTEIGIDVSSWQGEIDWPAVKKAGAEFAFIRLGYQKDYDGEYVVDQRFVENITGAHAAGLPVGVYFYSCANSLDQARQQAAWVLDQIKNYDVELGVAYDWENWSDFNDAGVSFYTLNKSAQTFLDLMHDAGYGGLLYGSKNYLDAFWGLPGYQIWLAQYYHRPTYTGEFKLWQMSDHGRIDGIKTDVDIDVLYRE